MARGSDLFRYQIISIHRIRLLLLSGQSFCYCAWGGGVSPTGGDRVDSGLLPLGTGRDTVKNHNEVSCSTDMDHRGDEFELRGGREKSMK